MAIPFLKVVWVPLEETSVAAIPLKVFWVPLEENLVAEPPLKVLCVPLEGGRLLSFLSGL